MKKIVAAYSLIMGIAVLGIWTVLLASGPVPEGKTELGFHLYSEFAMAIILIVSGIMLLKKRHFAVETNMGGLGMLVYSTLNAAGYYGERGDKPAMIIFIVLFILTVFAICGHYVKDKSPMRNPS